MRKLACFGLLFAAPLFTACSSQTFDVGGFPNDAGIDSGTSASSAPIDPIAGGNSWTYNVTVAGTYASCTNGPSTSSVTDHQTIGGKDAFLVASFCSGLGSYWFSIDPTDQDRVYEYDGTNWLLAIDAPVTDGHTWTNGTTSFIWKKIGSTTVDAGTFSDCWEIDDQAAPTYYNTTFCRGVGPVKWHFRDANQNGYDATLTSKSP